MPYVERKNGLVTGVYANSQPGYAEEWLEDDNAEILAFREPVALPPHLNGGALARFSGSAPVVVYESIGLSGVTRVSKGRYRAYHSEAMPTDSYSAVPGVFDALPRTVRITARTTAYVEIRVTDLAGAVQDPAEITVKIERVIQPS